MKEHKISLTEATMLALQGKLSLNESVDVTVDDKGTVQVDTEETTVIVDNKPCETCEEVSEEITDEVSNEPIVPEVYTEEPTVEEMTEEEPVVENKIEEAKLEETGEWDDSDDEMKAWTEELRIAAEELAKQIGGEVKSVIGIDKYAGPMAIINTPKHNDIEFWFDPEDDRGLSFMIPNIKEGFLRGDINYLASVLNQDEIPAEEVITENKQKEGKSEEKKLQEFVDPRPNETKLLDYLESVDADWEDVARNLLAFLSDDDVKEFCRINDYEFDENEEDEEIDESKKLNEQFKSSTFNSVITDFLKENNSNIASFKLSKLLKNETKLKIEGVITNVDNTSKDICLEMNKIRSGNKYTKYQLSEAKNIKLESKSDTTKTILTTALNNDNILECKYVVNK